MSIPNRVATGSALVDRKNVAVPMIETAEDDRVIGIPHVMTLFVTIQQRA